MIYESLKGGLVPTQKKEAVIVKKVIELLHFYQIVQKSLKEKYILNLSISYKNTTNLQLHNLDFEKANLQN